MASTPSSEAVGALPGGFASSETTERKVRAWLRHYGFDLDVTVPSVSNGIRCYPHSFRELWYSTLAAYPVQEAAAVGELVVLDYCLRKGASWRDEFGYAALHVAVERGQLAAAKRIYERLGDEGKLPAAARARNSLGATPAMLSTREKTDTEAATAKWCLLCGLFDADPRDYSTDLRLAREARGVFSPQSSRSPLPRLDRRSVAVAMRDAPPELCLALFRWTRTSAEVLKTYELALASLFVPSNPLVGVATVLEPALRAYLTVHRDPAAVARILAFDSILFDLGLYSSERDGAILRRRFPTDFREPLIYRR